MNPAFEAMLNHHLVVDPDGPSGLPVREMILQMRAVNISELGSNLSQPSGESSVMVSQGPDFDSAGGGFGDFPEPFLTNIKLFFNRWAVLPIDGGMAADGTSVDCIAIADDGSRLEVVTELDQRAVGD